MDATQRFWSCVTKTPECWLWEASTGGGGYGRFRVNGQDTYAHRFSYELHVAPIPDGLYIDHLCRTRRCVNPDHLEVVTHRENVLRGSGPTAINAAKTHCIRGHEFTPENTIRNPDGGRTCRTCRNAKVRQWRRRNLLSRSGAFKCPHCEAAFEKERGLRTHKVRAHGDHPHYPETTCGCECHTHEGESE